MTSVAQVEKSPMGRPAKLTDEVQEKIVAACRNHQSMDVAARLAGVARSQFHAWLATAAEASTHIAKGGALSKLSAHQRNCLNFQDKILTAMDQAEAIAVQSWINAGTRTQKTVKTTRKVVKTPEGEDVIHEETTVTEAPGDWRASQAWLGVRRSGYHPKTSIELTGADGGPIAIEMAAWLVDIKDRINGAIPVESEEVE